MPFSLYIIFNAVSAVLVQEGAGLKYCINTAKIKQTNKKPKPDQTTLLLCLTISEIC